MLKWFNVRSRRGLLAAAAASAALGLAGCDQIDLLRGAGESGAASASTRPGGAVRSSPMVEPGRGRTLWQAGNGAAEEATGNLRINVGAPEPGRGRPLALAFNRGIVTQLELVTIYAAGEASGAGDATFSGLMGADPDIDVYVYAVADEQLSPIARGRGLCGGLPTRHVAIAEFNDAEGERVLRLVSFHGEAAPGGAEGGDAGFCRLLEYGTG